MFESKIYSNCVRYCKHHEITSHQIKFKVESTWSNISHLSPKHSVEVFNYFKSGIKLLLPKVHLKKLYALKAEPGRQPRILLLPMYYFEKLTQLNCIIAKKCVLISSYEWYHKVISENLLLKNSKQKLLLLRFCYDYDTTVVYSKIKYICSFIFSIFLMIK